jgi:hypothetical protein
LRKREHQATVSDVTEQQQMPVGGVEDDRATLARFRFRRNATR